MAKATMNLQELFQEGFWHGQDLVDYNIRDVILKEDMDIDEFRDAVYDICHDADNGYRQYTPFEFFAYELNNAKNSEEAWDAYEDGIAAGIDKNLTHYINRYLNEEFLEGLKREHQNLLRGTEPTN